MRGADKSKTRASPNRQPGAESSGLGQAQQVEKLDDRELPASATVWLRPRRLEPAYRHRHPDPAGRGAGACRKGRGALAILGDASAKAAVSGERGYNAEIIHCAASHRSLAITDPAKAEDPVRTALAIVREQGTRRPELRAATSLARLWREQDRRAEARDLLAPSTARSPRASTPPT